MARQQLLRLAVAFALVMSATAPASAQGFSSAAPSAEAPPRERPKWLLPMHLATITTQALDAHSTYSAIHHATIIEANPLMKGLADKPAALVAVKAGVAAAIVYSTEKLARRHPVAAFATAAAVNSAYAMLVARNYSIAARAQLTPVPR